MGSQQHIKYYPEWYEDWLFNSLKIKEEEICQEKYLKPLFSLNSHWLKESYSKDEYKWDSDEVATSYALYYMTANIPKLWMTLENSGNWKNETLPKITEITEYGCGPGTFLWSYLFYLFKNAPDTLANITTIRGYDHSKSNLQIAEQLFKELRKRKEFSHIEAQFVFANWQDTLENDPHISDKHHLFLFGNSLIESSQNIDLILKHKFAHLLILEPGTSKHFHRLKVLRDQLINEGYSISFPCPGHSACPMGEDNWCHFSVNRFLLPFMQKISNAAGRKNHKHHFTSFLFSHDTKQERPSSWRLISGPRKVKGSAIRFLCNGQKIREVVLNKKEKSENNRAFIKAPTGSMANCSSELKNNRLYSKDHFS